MNQASRVDRSVLSSKNLRRLALGLLAFTSLALLTNCGSSSSSSSTATFTQVYTALQTNNCSSCHYSSGSAWTTYGVHLDFSSQSAAYTSLTTLTSSDTSTPACNGVNYVVSNSPTTSYLLAVLEKDYSTETFSKSGCVVPYNTHSSLIGSLESDDESLLLSWINAGVPNN